MLQEEEEEAEAALKVERGRERADFESGARLSRENPARAYVVARSIQIQMLDVRPHRGLRGF